MFKFKIFCKHYQKIQRKLRHRLIHGYDLNAMNYQVHHTDQQYEILMMFNGIKVDFR
jgi:hypothetical protein